MGEAVTPRATGAKRWRPSRGSLLIVAASVGTLLLLAGFLVAGERRERALRRIQAVRAVGLASLRYMQDYGAAPTCVEDLLSHGLLSVCDEVFVSMPGRGQRVAALSDVNQVRLSFPKSADGWQFNKGHLLDAKGSEPAPFVRLWDAAPDPGLRALENEISESWFQIVRGQEPSDPYLRRQKREGGE